jgi:hypothetical protein
MVSVIAGGAVPARRRAVSSSSKTRYEGPLQGLLESVSATQRTRTRVSLFGSSATTSEHAAKLPSVRIEKGFRRRVVFVGERNLKDQ